MKDDKDKLDAGNFYWDGLARLLNPDQGAVVCAYHQFFLIHTLTNLQKLFVACRDLNVPRMDVFCRLVYDHGSAKYADKNYLGLDLNRIIGAMDRHLRAAFLTNDPDESGFSHIVHVMANVLIAAEILDKVGHSREVVIS